MLPVFESWNLARPQVPRRSLLCPLEPIGIGTPFVESLTSYISRLAAVHAVIVSDLVGYLLADCVPPDQPIISARDRRGRIGSGFKSGTHAINGLAEDARRWIIAVETATDRRDLRLLTLTPLKQVFCKQSLFRNTQAWCPECFQDWRRTGKPVYLPLSWHLRMVTICLKHRQPLDTVCPHCGESFGPLFAKSRPGCCSRCWRWLAEAPPRRAEVYRGPDDDQMWMANSIGDVLGAMPQLEQNHLRDILTKNICTVVGNVSDGNQTVFADLTGSRGNAVCVWLAGRTLPRPDRLFRICRRLNILVSEMLRRSPTLEVPKEITDAGAVARRRGVWREDPERLKAALKEALTEDPPPSLHDVALRYHYRTCTPLRRLDAECCKQITTRYRMHRRPWRSAWAIRDRECTPVMIEEILRASIVRDKPIPVSQIAAELGYESANRLREHFPELCREIAVKQSQNRATQREEVRIALVKATLEEPPSTAEALAAKLGCNRGTLYLYFPDLYRQFLEARRAWAARQREGIRANVEAVAAEMAGASMPEICRTAGIGLQFLMKRFPDLYRQIVSRYLERCDNTRKQKRETLRQDVRRAVAELSARGLRPTFTRVAPLLSDQAAKDWKLIHQEIAQSLLERGHALEP